MNNSKYIGIDLRKDGISVAVRNAPGTKASMILQFIHGLLGSPSGGGVGPNRTDEWMVCARPANPLVEVLISRLP